MSRKYKFSIPYTHGMIDVLDNLDASAVQDIYFSDNKFGSARSIFNGQEMFEELYAIREKYGIKLHYLVNPSLYSNEFYSKVPELIDYVADINVDLITLNNTYLLRAGIVNDFRKNNPSIELKNSVNNIVKTFKDFVFMHQELGVTSVIVDRALNRDLDTLEKMKKYSDEHGIKITLLVNEGCIVDCKWKQWDDLIISQIKIHDDRSMTDRVYTDLGCVKHFQSKPAEWLKTAFTLPTDIRKFDGLVDVIKIAGRNFPLDRWYRVVNAYLNESGNVKFGELLSTSGDMGLFHVLANDLTDAGFNDITKNCKSVCGIECNLCDKFYEKVKRTVI